MTYEIVLEKCGRTTSVIIENVKSEGEAKLKAMIEVAKRESGFTVSRTRLIG